MNNMNKIFWLSDIHLNHCDLKQRNNFYNELKSKFPTDIFISGDIGTGLDFPTYLKEMEKILNPCKIYFVLGNHDYYNSSFEKSIKEAQKTDKNNLIYFHNKSVIIDNKLFIGFDGNADGNYGDFFLSNWRIINDFYLISDFMKCNGNAKEIYKILQEQSKRGVNEFEALLKSEINRTIELHLNINEVYLITHIIPFSTPFLRGSIECGYNDSDKMLPIFTSKILGDKLIEVMKNYIDIKLTILCGHSHCEIEMQCTDNIFVKAAPAEYGIPIIAGEIQ